VITSTPLGTARGAVALLALRVAPDTLARMLDAVTPLDELDVSVADAIREARVGLDLHAEGLRATDHGSTCAWPGSAS
jgi:hypothetical protein